MPYIPKERRSDAEFTPETPGELNFAISKLIDGYVMRRADFERGNINYGILAQALSSVEGAKMEFYRRVVIPYEDAKRAQHGDVYRSVLSGTKAG